MQYFAAFLLPFFYMNAWRFTILNAKEEKPIGLNFKNSGSRLSAIIKVWHILLYVTTEPGQSGLL